MLAYCQDMRVVNQTTIPMEKIAELEAQIPYSERYVVVHSKTSVLSTVIFPAKSLRLTLKLC
jgi:hypothetical protein